MTTTSSPRRVDAERNRDRIVGAAREAFADTTADVSMAEVARRAGVGSATLYRNFANRHELLEALYVDEVEGLCAAAEQGDGEPATRLTAWLDRFWVFLTNKQAVALELLKQSDADAPLFTGSRDRVIAAGRPLLEAAQRSGAARTDLTIEQTLDLLAAVAHIPGEDAYRLPIFRAALDAIHSTRPGDSSALSSS